MNKLPELINNFKKDNEELIKSMEGLIEDENCIYINVDYGTVFDAWYEHLVALKYNNGEDTTRLQSVSHENIDKLITTLHDELLARENIDKSQLEKLQKTIININIGKDIPLKKMKEITNSDKLKELLRRGRALGVLIYMATSKATYSEVPEELKSSITKKQIFKLNNKEDD